MESAAICKAIVREGRHSFPMNGLSGGDPGHIVGTSNCPHPTTTSPAWELVWDGFVLFVASFVYLLIETGPYFVVQGGLEFTV